MSWENRKRQRGLCTSDQAYLGVNTIPPVIPVRRYHLIRFCHSALRQYNCINPLVCLIQTHVWILYDYVSKFFFLIVCWILISSFRWTYSLGGYDISGTVAKTVRFSIKLDPDSEEDPEFHGLEILRAFLEDHLVHHMFVSQW